MDSSAGVHDELSELCGDHWAPRQVKVLENPSPLEFLRDCVSCYEPCIIRGAIDHWPILNASLDELFAVYAGQVAGGGDEKRIKVNITPDGHGDCVKLIDGVRTFVYPAETELTLSAFKAMMEDQRPGDAVPYASLQDNSLAKEFPELLATIDSTLPLAQDVFFNPEAARSDAMLRAGEAGADAGLSAIEATVAMPEAVNLWVGDERSVSSMHKDFFENLYCVVTGEKTFTLMPPADMLYLGAQERTFPTAAYTLPEGRDESEFNRRIQSSEVNCRAGGEKLVWLDLDPAPGHPQPRLVEQFAHPLHVTVRAGEVLYLPAMWLHRVSQTRLTIAVNYWYEQRFDFRFVYAGTVRALRNQLQLRAGEQEQEQEQESERPPDGQSRELI